MPAGDQPKLPRSVRVWIPLSSWLVPPVSREQWEADWQQELQRWAQAGAPVKELRKRAQGAVRDALWQRRRSGYNPVGEMLARPFRAEAALVVLAAAAWFLTGPLRKVEPPYPNAERVVILERGISSVGARRPMLSRTLAEGAAELASVDQLALFRLGYRIQGAAFVSANFFDVLGVSPALGRVLREGDDPMSVVVSDRYWREQMASNPGAVGTSINLAHQDYKVVGVLPAAFHFERADLHYYLPLPDYVKTVGGAALLRAGTSVASAENEFRGLAAKLEPGWNPGAFGLRGTREAGGREAWLALSLGLLAFLASAVYLAIRRVRGWKYYLALATRLLLTLAALTAIQIVIGQLMFRQNWAPSFVPWWVFMAACTVAAIIVVRDHLNRCHICLERLRMPVSLGNWSSIVMDPPGTEYVCPKGHGLLYTPGSGGNEDHWTELDSSWRDLFEHRP